MDMFRSEEMQLMQVTDLGSLDFAAFCASTLP